MHTRSFSWNDSRVGVSARFVAALVFFGCGSGSEGPSAGGSSSGIEPGNESGDAGTGGGEGATDDGPGGGADDDTGGQSCMASMDCPEMAVCVEGVCIPTDGECSDDTECDGDTYCCAEGCLPDGESGGYCIPYGEGPRGDVNDECLADVVIGLFEPSLQCEWTAPPPGDAHPDHVNVLTTPMVAQLPSDSGAAGEIIIVAYNGEDGGAQSGYGSDPAYYGVIRILDGQGCGQLETIDDPDNRIIAATPPAIADLDGDGTAEIVSLRAGSGVIAFTWDAASQRFMRYWVSTQSDIAGTIRWDGPAIHDLDDDGFPEVLSAGEVYDGQTGARLNPGQTLVNPAAGILSVAGDLDGDGAIELIGDEVYRWSSAMSRWEVAYPGGDGGRHYAFADFGTPGATPDAFDAQTLDGIAEIVTVGNNLVQLHTLQGQLLLSAPISGGGPPTIGDFDDDGRPEIASAGGTEYRVYDLDCAGAPAGCAAGYIRWSRPSQDASSSTTGSSIFDFEGDGQAEAVYADECFVRVYEGGTGEVLYSGARTSCTWYENAIVADPDFDENTEILVGSNRNCNVSCPEIDPIHRGVRCETATDCASGSCVEGFCRCADTTGCPEGHVCGAPPEGTPGEGNTCRASHPPDIALTGVRVFRDRLDRWASSRPMWNQHAYSVTNVEDDLSVAASSTWTQNFREPSLNNYRQNRQGDASAEDQPDITGKLESSACSLDGSDVTLTGTVCNRGLKAVAAALPATFYAGDPAQGNVLCVAYTSEPVPVGECRDVSCTIDSTIEGEVTMVVNDDGQGGALTVECNDDNNTDVVAVSTCVPG